MTATLRIVAEALHETTAATAEEKKAEKNGRAGVERVGIVDQDPCDMVHRKMVLEEVQLEDSGGNEKHASFLVDHLTLLHRP